MESSAIASIGYDRATAVLEIEFTSGEIYLYRLVPSSVHRALLDAESKGRYFVAHIRDAYPSAHLT